METVDLPTLDTFKIQVDRALGHLFAQFFCQEDLGQMILGVTFSLVFYGSLSIPHK